LTSVLGELKPDESLKHKFQFFTGPKRPTLVQQYGLSDLVYYGWPIFAWFAVPMTAILHAFYGVVCNYGLAIVMLTIVVRGCMFPISRKQAYASIKMQELQPEMKRIQEKYKKDTEGRVKALQDLYRKHHFSPYGGCLTAFIQIPVFLGLWRSLMVDVELRDSPLLTHSIRWCSNLAAPDMLFNWSSFMPSWIVNGPGILWLGPYFNLLPILALLMILWQQKKMMPPPADEQAAMQQKVMKYVMIFTGVLFFKVAAGTCIYLITSTLWGLGERQFLPKHKPVDGDNATETRAEAKAKARLEKIAEAARTKKKKKSSLFSSLFGWVPYRAS
jgi:YidC/Oxa1 family membrane protein insertase